VTKSAPRFDGAARVARRAYLVLVLGVLGVPLAGCSSAEPEPAAPPIVGPAPLRRLSNSEYLNALHDLFPAQEPALPTLPNDTVVAGFENAAEAQQPSDVRVARYETIADVYAAGATVDTPSVRALTGCEDWTTPSLASACARGFLERVGGRLFRRPLLPAERDRLALRFQAWAAAVDFEGAVRLSLSAMLQAPQFLYRPEPAPAVEGAPTRTSIVPVEPYAMASRLSFFLWESVPDDALLAAAASDELRTEEQLRAQAARMLKDDRARRVLGNFHRQWLGLDRVLVDEHLVRTPAVDPAWTAASQRSAARESQLFVENVLMASGSLRELFTSRRAWVDGEMARVYGVAAPADPSAFVEVTLPGAERAGILTRAAFLAGYSHRGATSPPVRGNGLQLRVLCQLPRSPPPGVDLSMPTAAPGQGPQTNRMLFEARTRPAFCQGCHAGLNGFGFGLEHYDAAGHYQASEQGLAIDARGAIVGTDVDRPFDGALDLSAALANSEVVDRCATQQWLRYALGRAPTADEEPILVALSRELHASGGDLRALLVSIVTAPTFRLRRIPSP
jgi:hypothetical protein